MKVFIILVLLCSGLFAQADYNAEQKEVTVVISTDSVIVDLYTVFGVKGVEELKLLGVMTDATMTSDTLTFKVYDAVNDAYKTMAVFNGGSDLTYTIEANKTYPLDPRYFNSVDRLVLKFDASEAAARSIVLIGRVF